MKLAMVSREIRDKTAIFKAVLLKIETINNKAATAIMVMAAAVVYELGMNIDKIRVPK